MTISVAPARPQLPAPGVSRIPERLVEHLSTLADSGRARVAVADLAAVLDVSERTVQRALRELESAGRIAVERGRRHAPSSYRLLSPS